MQVAQHVFHQPVDGGVGYAGAGVAHQARKSADGMRPDAVLIDDLERPIKHVMATSLDEQDRGTVLDRDRVRGTIPGILFAIFGCSSLGTCRACSPIVRWPRLRDETSP